MKNGKVNGELKYTRKSLQPLVDQGVLTQEQANALCAKDASEEKLIESGIVTQELVERIQQMIQMAETQNQE
ncbi:MAG: hypothetical protein IJ088_02655 [Clostridia bacterium]|nr:hypothetical protein [Clostridia bacterium]